VEKLRLPTAGYANGIDSKFGVSDNISVRPFIYFPNGGTSFGSALTYNFNLRNNSDRVLITPFVGGSTAVRVASALAEDGAQASISILPIEVP
jgi:hypothetical protein